MTSYAALGGARSAPDAWLSAHASPILLGDDSADSLALARLLAVATDGAVLQSTESVEVLMRRRHPGMIVVRSSPRRATRAELDALVRSAPCPVAVAPAGYAYEAPHGVHRIGVALDGWEESRLALAEAVDVGAGCSAELCLLMVADTHTASSTTQSGRSTDWLAGHRALAERYLSGVEQGLPRDLRVCHRTLAGQVAPALIEAVGSEALDLLALGSRRRGPVASIVLGSVSRVLLHDPPCALLVCPRGGGRPVP